MSVPDAGRKKVEEAGVSNNLNREANFDLGRADATSQKMLLKLNISLSTLPTALPPTQSNVLLGGIHLALVMMVSEVEMRSARYEFSQLNT